MLAALADGATNKQDIDAALEALERHESGAPEQPGDRAALRRLRLWLRDTAVPALFPPGLAPAGPSGVPNAAGRGAAAAGAAAAAGEAAAAAAGEAAAADKAAAAAAAAGAVNKQIPGAPAAGVDPWDATLGAPEPERLAQILELVFSWDEFDVFAAQAASGGHALVAVALEVLRRSGVAAALGLDGATTRSYLQAVEESYRPGNPYHNAVHAADVVQSVSSLMLTAGVLQSMAPVEVLAAVLGAAVHDVDHRGVDNAFLVKTQDELSITYNGRSINENHHAATAVRLMRRPGCDLLAPLPPADRSLVRELMVDIVRSTDMAKHGRNAAALGEAIAAERADRGPDLCGWTAAARAAVLAALVHAADISNAAKAGWLAVEWARCVMEEFGQQADLERALGFPPHPFYDRRNANAPASQHAFISRIVAPTFELLARVSPAAAAAPLARAAENAERWAALRARGEAGFGEPDARPEGARRRALAAAWPGEMRRRLRERGLQPREDHQQQQQE